MEIYKFKPRVNAQGTWTLPMPKDIFMDISGNIIQIGYFDASGNWIRGPNPNVFYRLEIKTGDDGTPIEMIFISGTNLRHTCGSA